MSSVLSGAGANSAKAFKNLYDLWFDKKGNETQYLKTLSQKGINLTNISSILNGAVSIFMVHAHGYTDSSRVNYPKQEQHLDLQQGDSKGMRKTQKGITNLSKNWKDDKISDTGASSSRDLSLR